MRTIRTKVYKFSELSKAAKQTAIEWYRSRDTELQWADENRHSMERFAEIFPIKVTDWCYGRRGEGVSFRFETDRDEIEQLSGQRLATYIWNNYRDQIYSRMYYSMMGSIGLTDHKINHKRVTSEQIKNECPNKGKWSNSYHSAITIEKMNCPLTGYCMDNELLFTIYEFLDKPDSRNFEDLLEDCFNEWIKACNKDIEWQNSDEFITEEIENYDYEFTKDGKAFNS